MGAAGDRKATSGVMVSWPAKAHSRALWGLLAAKKAAGGQIDPARWCVAVGSPPPGRAAAAKGTGVHWLKGDVSWVKVGAEARSDDLAFSPGMTRISRWVAHGSNFPESERRETVRSLSTGGAGRLTGTRG